MLRKIAASVQPWQKTVGVALVSIPLNLAVLKSNLQVRP